MPQCENCFLVYDLCHFQASRNKLFDAMHPWLVLSDVDDPDNGTYIDNTFRSLNLSVDADITVVTRDGNYLLNWKQLN